MTTTIDLDDLRSHIGRTQTATDVVLPGPANLLRLALGRPEPEYREGDVLPPAWLALYFLPRVAADGLRPDGSPRDTGVVPPLALQGLAVISVKHGNTGTLVFATVTSRVHGPGGLAIEEERRTVFREEVKAGDRNQAPRREPPPTDAPWRRTVTPDPVLLFRYSALTFNSHRIHYDRAWAMEVEGYPGLVVHGPLTTTLLIDFARDQNPDRRIVAYSTQARAPLFDTAPFELRGRSATTGRGAELWAVTPEGTIAMSAEVELA